LKFATLRPRSEKELQGWLKRKKVHQSLHKDLFNRLKHLDLINDLEFAKWWVEQRLAFRPKSQRIMNYELRIKGIKPDIIKQVLGETEIDEEKIARELLEKKAYKWKGIEPRLARQKMAQYLAGKGFNWDIIEKVVKV
jgi:regulatory protein